MSAPEPASLTSALLTRKGFAAPALVAEPPPLANDVERPAAGNGVLWRFWGRRLRAEVLRVVPIRLLAADSKPAPKPRRRNPDSRSRVSLRLDEKRHLRLRLTAAHQNRSMQDVMMSALDNHLMECKQELIGGRCACLEDGLAPNQCAVLGAIKG